MEPSLHDPGPLPVRVSDWILWGQGRLANLENSFTESRALMGTLLGSATAPWTRGQEHLPEAQSAIFRDWIERRAAREPFHYIVGSVSFFGRIIGVGPGVLVPRPETEHLVAAALDHLNRRPQEGPPRVLDLGAGSGAIILTLLLEWPSAVGVAVEHEPEAIRILLENRTRFGLEDRLGIIRGSWGKMLSEAPSFDLILSNPPYIRTDVLATLDPEVRDHEPVTALDGGPDGLSCYREILAFAPGLLNDGGLLAFEIGADQAKAFQPGGAALSGLTPSFLGSFSVETDVSGRDRIITWKK